MISSWSVVTKCLPFGLWNENALLNKPGEKMTDNDRQNSTDEAEESNQQRPAQSEERAKQGGTTSESPAPVDDDIIIK
ncbi:MAG TPA: hypothetical protein DC047_13855 [Blastocatellia bacterium]|nr:hypothetical protein [Blastocatellia bacterium]